MPSVAPVSVETFLAAEANATSRGFHGAALQETHHAPQKQVPKNHEKRRREEKKAKEEGEEEAGLR